MRSFFATLRQLVIPAGAQPGTPRIVLGPDVPASLAAMNDANITAAALWYFNATDYFFIATGTWVPTGLKIVVIGTRSAGLGLRVYQVYRPDAGDMSWGTTVFDAATPNINFNDVVISVLSSAGFEIDNLSAPRGLRPDHGMYDAGANLATSAGAEVAIPAATWDVEPTISIPPGRLYKVTINVRVRPSAATDSLTALRLRLGSGSVLGTVLGIWVIDPPAAANTTPNQYDLVGWFQNSTGSTVTSALSLTNLRIAGAAQTSLFGDFGVPIRVVLEDQGEASQQTGLDTVPSV